MKENIILFFSDQQRYDTLGCNGQTMKVTPNLDKVAAEEGVNFTSCFTPQPVCGPARSVLQTGLYPTQTGCFTNRISLPLNINTLAKRLKTAGYNVAYVGKWHLASDQNENNYTTSPVPPERRGGYDDYWMASDMLEFTSHGYGGYVFDKDGNKVEFEKYRCDAITDYAIRYIDNYDDDQPFFLMISHIEPHHQNDHSCYEGPLGSKEEFKDFDAPADLPENIGDWETQYPDYLGCCKSLDYNYGRVLECLKKKDLYENTMIIYTSDHGNHFRTLSSEKNPNGGTDDYKRTSFENTIHVPLIIKGKDFQGGQKINELVSLMDIPKTILHAAGYKDYSDMQGYALQNCIENNKWREDVYIQISESFTGRALRTQRYKYVIHAPEKNPWRTITTDVWQEKYLFDLDKDPLEKNNLIDDPAYRNIKEDLKMRLIRNAGDAGENIVSILPRKQFEI